jgi:hypothetical protein
MGSTSSMENSTGTKATMALILLSLRKRNENPPLGDRDVPSCQKDVPPTRQQNDVPNRLQKDVRPVYRTEIVPPSQKADLPNRQKKDDLPRRQEKHVHPSPPDPL